MKPLPGAVLDLLATLPDEKPCKIVLNTNGRGHWEVEIFARYVIDDAAASACPSPPLPPGEHRLT